MGAALLAETYGVVRGRPVPFTRQKVVEMCQTHWLCSHEGIRHDLGWTPAVPLEEGARRSAAWYRSQGLL
jgi:nucleoside-diphosphate-sugar epimerase